MQQTKPMQQRSPKETLRMAVTVVFYAFLIIALVIALTWVGTYFGVYVEALEILKVVIWPFVILVAMFFFQKVFTYLFFSIEEFNFFGAKGTLKNVHEVIEEKVKEQLEAREREVEREKQIEIMNELVDSLVAENTNEQSKKEEITTTFEKVVSAYEKLLDQKDNEIKELKEFQFRKTIETFDWEKEKHAKASADSTS